MAVLVDAAVWPHRGDRWAHLVSDASHDELHEFAHRLGVPFVAHQGDHYDVPASVRDAAIVAGAEPVDARVLVRRLRAAGLRDRRAHVPWRWLVREVPVDQIDDLAALLAGTNGAAGRLLAAATDLADRTGAVPRLSVGRRPGQVLAGARVDGVVPPGGPPLERTTDGQIHRSAGPRGTFVEVVTLAVVSH